MRAQFCASDALQNDAGSFAPRYCQHHAREWGEPRLWLAHATSLVVPSMGPEMKFLLGHYALVLLGWINWIVGAVVAVLIYRLAMGVYQWGAYVKKV